VGAGPAPMLREAWPRRPAQRGAGYRKRYYTGFSWPPRFAFHGRRHFGVGERCFCAGIAPVILSLYIVSRCKEPEVVSKAGRRGAANQSVRAIFSGATGAPRSSMRPFLDRFDCGCGRDRLRPQPSSHGEAGWGIRSIAAPHWFDGRRGRLDWTDFLSCLVGLFYVRSWVGGCVSRFSSSAWGDLAGFGWRLSSMDLQPSLQCVTWAS